MSCCASFSHLSFDFIEGEGSLPPEKMMVVKKYCARFNRWDRLILYPIIVILIADLLVLLYQLLSINNDNVDSQRQSIFTGQILFIIGLALVITVVRIVICKFLLLHPTLNMLRSIPMFTGAIEMSFAGLCFVVAIVLSTVIAILAVQNNQETALLIAVFDIIAYTLGLICYRLHIAAYISVMCKENAGMRNVV